MSITVISPESQAYVDGYKSGRADKLLQWRSEYAWYGVTLDARGTYSYHYSIGYRRGWNGQTF